MYGPSALLNSTRKPRLMCTSPAVVGPRHPEDDLPLRLADPLDDPRPRRTRGACRAPAPRLSSTSRTAWWNSSSPGCAAARLVDPLEARAERPAAGHRLAAHRGRAHRPSRYRPAPISLDHGGRSTRRRRTGLSRSPRASVREAHGFVPEPHLVTPFLPAQAARDGRGFGGRSGRPRWSWLPHGVLAGCDPHEEPKDVRLLVERRHRDGARSDFRDDRVREIPHLGRTVDEDAGNVTLSGPLGPFSGRNREAENALRVLGPL